MEQIVHAATREETRVHVFSGLQVALGSETEELSEN